jgi:hypothetical protein
MRQLVSIDRITRGAYPADNEPLSSAGGVCKGKAHANANERVSLCLGVHALQCSAGQCSAGQCSAGLVSGVQVSAALKPSIRTIHA